MTQERDLEYLRAERKRALAFKNILPLVAQLERLKVIPKSELQGAKVFYGDFVRLEIPHLSEESFTLEIGRAHV